MLILSLAGRLTIITCFTNRNGAAPMTEGRFVFIIDHQWFS